MDKREQVIGLLHQCVKDYAEQSGRTVNVKNDTSLIGPNAPVDSLGLVMLITGFEAKLNETFNTELVLANEKAMSMSRSPFRSIDALADYAVSLLNEASVSK